MARFPEQLREKLSRREVRASLRRLPVESEAPELVDFSSNDYLGFSRNLEISESASQLLSENNGLRNGATGSRLLSGNHPLYAKLELRLAEFHQTEAALVFNSGYDANIGFFGCVPQRGDIVLYDEHVHASIRDGIKMGNARSYKFSHNDLGDLKKRCQNIGITGGNGIGSGISSEFETASATQRDGQKNAAVSKSSKLSSRQKHPTEVYIVTESVFSMDGDSPDLKALSEFCQSNGYYLIVDEAHAIGVFGKKGKGLIQHYGIENTIFARIVTFGKAIGCHGAAILGSEMLKAYLVNFARSLIYTTGLPPHTVAAVLSAYELLTKAGEETSMAGGNQLLSDLSENIAFFNRGLETNNLAASIPFLIGYDDSINEKMAKALANGGQPEPFFIPSTSAIHCCVIPGNDRVRAVAESIRAGGFDVRAILSPTVPEGKERLRICLHSYNTKDEIQKLLDLLSREVMHL